MTTTKSSKQRTSPYKTARAMYRDLTMRFGDLVPRQAAARMSATHGIPLSDLVSQGKVPAQGDISVSTLVMAVRF